jgi:hypothetical protein
MVTLIARLGRDSNGDWLARKSIPAAIQEAYRARYGVLMDEEFRRPGTTPSKVVWEEFRRWEGGVAVKLDHVRSTVGPRGDLLLFREVQSLTREWRAWVFNKRRQRPTTAAAWAVFLAPVAAAEAARDESDANDESATGHRVRAEVAALGCLSEFLAEAGIAVVGLGYDRFVDAIDEQFRKMQAACRRREERER